MNKELLQKNFEDRGFTVRFFETGAEAKDYLCSKLTARSIGFGGSVTLKELGLYEALSEKNVVVWHHRIWGDEIKDLASHAKIYLTSANAVAETGQIVNIDGAGNRLAMTLWGPEQVYYLVGKNKIVSDLSAALDRAKNVATPKNAYRLGAKTPCGVKGDRCYQCNSKEKLCRLTLIMDGAPHTPSEILFINEELGY